MNALFRHAMPLLAFCLFLTRGAQAAMSQSVVKGKISRHDSTGTSAHVRYVNESNPSVTYETDTDPYTGAYEIRGVWTEVEDAPVPERFALYGNHPNPFESETKFVFETPYSTDVKLRVYNIKGQTVDEVVASQDFKVGAGVHGIDYNPPDLAAGVYLYTVEAFGKTLAGRIVSLGGGGGSRARIFSMRQARRFRSNRQHSHLKRSIPGRISRPWKTHLNQSRRNNRFLKKS